MNIEEGIEQVSRAHKIQLKTNKTQEAYFRKACGTSRFVYNWALATWETQFKSGQKPSGMSLKKEFNSIYKQQFPWIAEVHRDCHSQPFANLQTAMQNFFKKKAKHPNFKKKGKCKDSFYVANDKFRVDGKSVILPVIGKIRMTEELRFQGKITGAVVSRSADRWYISIQVECNPILKPKTGNEKLGIDLGVKTSVVCSDGSVYQSPKPLKKKLRQLKHLQRSVSKKVKGSNNRRKATQKVAKVHWKANNIRRDFLHKTSTDIIRKSQAICVEDLSVKNMLGNHKLARAITEQGFREFRSFLEYKAKAYGVGFVVADRFFPSSKTCSLCGSIKSQLKLSDRVYNCEVCGCQLDRDFNASCNLSKQLGTVSSEVKPVDYQEAFAFTEADRLKQEFQKCAFLRT